MPLDLSYTEKGFTYPVKIPFNSQTSDFSLKRGQGYMINSMRFILSERRLHQVYTLE